MKHLLLKPLLIIIALVAAGSAQGFAANQLDQELVAAPTSTAEPASLLTEAASSRVVYADAPAAAAIPSASSSPTTSTSATPAAGASAAPLGASPIKVAPTSAVSSSKGTVSQPSGAAAPPAPVAQTGFSTSSGRLYDNGRQIVLHGVNWFGFDTDDHVAHGLWARNWQDMISQIKATGFNAVRLPVCPASLHGASVSGIDYSQNADLQGLNSQQVMDKIVDGLNAQGIYVLMDMHRSDCENISDLWYTSTYSESEWISDLQGMASRYASLPYFLGIDLKNEPQGTATWGTGNLATDWNLAADRAGHAVLATDPNILVFVEGVENNPSCTDTNAHFWGGNLAPALCTPISTAQIPPNRLVYSPHVYGPDVYAQPYFSAANFPANMPAIWDAQFGFLAQQGYAVVPGEWGGRYGTGGGVPSDVTWQNALTAYYAQRNICSSFYWSWNPNSADTGGVLEDDWKTVWPQKAQLLQSYWNSCTT